MKREFKYEEITIEDIEMNGHLCFVCDGDNKTVTVVQNEE